MPIVDIALMSQLQYKQAEVREAAILASLRHFRKVLKVTQVQLAQLTGIDQPTLSSIENGKCRFTVRHLLKISSALKIDAKRLLDAKSKQKGTR